MRHEHDLDLSTWSDKVSDPLPDQSPFNLISIMFMQKNALESALTETERELAIMRGDRDAAVRRSAQIESRFTDMQVRTNILNVVTI